MLGVCGLRLKLLLLLLPLPPPYPPHHCPQRVWRFNPGQRSRQPHALRAFGLGSLLLPDLPPCSPMSRTELQALKEWLEDNLSKRFIRASSSLPTTAAAPALSTVPLPSVPPLPRLHSYTSPHQYRLCQTVRHHGTCYVTVRSGRRRFRHSYVLAAPSISSDCGPRYQHRSFT